MNDDSRLSFERLEDRVLLSAPTAMLPATFAIMGSTAFVIGTSGDDYFEVDLHQRTVRENGAIHAIPVGVTDVQLDGLGGDDFFGLFSAAGSESVRILPGACLLESSGAGLTATAVSMETIVYLGHGYRGLNGDNRVVFIDSAGDDVFTGRAVRSQMAGAGFLNVAHAVDEAVAIANRGGVDLANLFDSAGSDLFVARPGVATLNGSLFRQQSQGFETVAAFGGTDAANDEARLFDTSDNDLFTASPASASLMGPGLDVRAYGFDSINAIASTGNDRAVLLDAPGDGQIELAHLNGVTGYIFEGVDGRDIAGTAVSSAGDMNGDGIADLRIGSPGSMVGSDAGAGKTFVVFGNAAGFGTELNLSTLNGTNGFVIEGNAADMGLGFSGSAIGDVNGDGFADLLVSAPASADPASAGSAFVIFG
ncbi:MAG: FG-GAP repeat protein, partial [Planctomycetaceae bacterium]|nr:FG-GAP repeat protein [Planctomycetaceae bacterium]